MWMTSFREVSFYTIQSFEKAKNAYSHPTKKQLNWFYRTNSVRYKHTQKQIDKLEASLFEVRNLLYVFTNTDIRLRNRSHFDTGMQWTHICPHNEL